MIVLHKQKDIEKPLSPKTLERVESILDRGSFGNADISIVKNQIFKALSGEKSAALALLENGNLAMYHELPIKLQEDKDIALKVSQGNPDIYEKLSLKLRHDVDIQKQIVSSLIEKNANILKVLSIVESNPKNTKALKGHISKLLEHNSIFFAGDRVAILLYEVYLHDKKTYDILFQKGIFSYTKSNITLGSRYLDILVKYQKDLEGASPEEVQEKLFAYLVEMLGIPVSKLSKTCNELLGLLVSQIRIVKKEENKGKDESEEDDVMDAVKDEDEDEDYIPSVGPYNFVPIGNGNTYNVSDNAGNSVRVEKTEYEMMNNVSLENYVNFSMQMKNLGLGFLVEKHKSKIQIATQVHFFEGEGMSPARILKFLNKIGKRLGVPPSSYIDKDGNRETLCFNDIGAAYFKFREVASGGKIGKHNFDVANKGSNSIVELYMKVENIINPSSGEFSITKFENTKPDNLQKAA